MPDEVRLKWLLSESDARAGAAAEQLPLLSVSISWGVRRREASDATTRAASEDLSNYKVCRAGNLVINRMRAFQGALGIAGEDGIVSRKLDRRDVPEGLLYLGQLRGRTLPVAAATFAGQLERAMVERFGE